MLVRMEVYSSIMRCMAKDAVIQIRTSQEVKDALEGVLKRKYHGLPMVRWFEMKAAEEIAGMAGVTLNADEIRKLSGPGRHRLSGVTVVIDARDLEIARTQEVRFGFAEEISSDSDPEESYYITAWGK